MSMSILIAEDNVAQRHYLREILEKEFPSHQPIVEAADGEETVKLALEHKPEVSILDIQMPKLSGVARATAPVFGLRKIHSRGAVGSMNTSGAIQVPESADEGRAGRGNKEG